MKREMCALAYEERTPAECCAGPSGRVDVIRILRRWRHRWRSRRALGSLLARDDGEYLLTDAGLDREAARRECRKPFWQE